MEGLYREYHYDRLNALIYKTLCYYIDEMALSERRAQCLDVLKNRENFNLLDLGCARMKYVEGVISYARKKIEEGYKKVNIIGIDKSCTEISRLIDYLIHSYSSLSEGKREVNVIYSEEWKILSPQLMYVFREATGREYSVSHFSSMIKREGGDIHFLPLSWEIGWKADSDNLFSFIRDITTVVEYDVITFFAPDTSILREGLKSIIWEKVFPLREEGVVMIVIDGSLESINKKIVESYVGSKDDFYIFYEGINKFRDEFNELTTTVDWYKYVIIVRKK